MASTLFVLAISPVGANLDKDVKKWCEECTSCQQSKVTRHTKSPVNQFTLPSERFSTVHIDIVGPLPPTKIHGELFNNPYRYLLTCIDRSTRYIEAAPMTEITESTVATTFLNIWISRWGVPLHVVTDRGKQFESELFSELSKLVGFHRLRTTSYHPQANSLIERAHRTIKSAIMARKQSWIDALPIVLLGIRAAPNDSGYSPFTAVTGSSLLLPRPMISQESLETEEFNNESIKRLSKEMHLYNFSNNLSLSNHHGTPKSYIPANLNKCSHVWLRVDRVRRPLEVPYSGPFEVIDRKPKFFIIKTLTKEETVSIDRLKPAILNCDNKQDKLKNKTPPTDQTKLLYSTEENKPPNEVLTRSGRRVKFKKNPDSIYY